MGVSPYVQVEGFIKEGVQLVPLVLGGPGHHLREFMPGLQGELDEGVARAWWGEDISPLPPPLLPQHGRPSPARVPGHTGVAGGRGSGHPHRTPQPVPRSREGEGTSPTLSTRGSATGGCNSSDLSWRCP